MFPFCPLMLYIDEGARVLFFHSNFSAYLVSRQVFEILATAGDIHRDGEDFNL